MQYLKADTITEVTVGPAVAVGDGFTPVTNLVGSSADEFEIIKHAGTSTVTIAGTLAAITGADGYYNLDLSATDTNTEGRLTLLINDDDLILPIRHEFMVVNANVFDSLFAADTTDYLRTDAFQIAGTTQDATDLADFAAEGYDPATNKVTGVLLTDTLTTYTGNTLQTADVANLNDVAATDIVSGGAINTTGGAVDTVTTNTDMVGTDSAALASVVGALADGASDGEVTSADTLMQYIKQLINILEGAPGVVTLKAAAAPASGVSLSEMIRAIYDDTVVIGTPTDTDIATDIANVQADTDDLQTQIGTAGAGLGDLGGMSTAMKAEIVVEVDNALDTVIAELGVAAPAITPTIRTALMLPYMALRNNTIVQTSGVDALEIHNNAGTKICSKALTDDGNDYDEATMISG